MSLAPLCTCPPLSATESHEPGCPLSVAETPERGPMIGGGRGGNGGNQASVESRHYLCMECFHPMSHHHGIIGCQYLFADYGPKCGCKSTRFHGPLTSEREALKKEIISAVVHADDSEAPRPGIMTAHKAGDAVNHPAHYNAHPSGIEAITVVEHMTFNVGNAVKYAWRAGLKSASPVEDLKKAVWYLNREVSRLEKQEKEGAK